MNEQITFKFMVDYLNADKNRKIQLLKNHICNFNGLKYSEIMQTVDSVNKMFSNSLSREMSRQRKLVRVYGKCNLNRPIFKQIIVR